MTLKIYGNMNSSTFRVVWAAEELGLDYELIDIPIDQCATHPILARLNPNRKIPVIDDEGVVIWESMAINSYLAKKAGGDLAPLDAVEEAQVQMWGYWISIDIQKDCYAVLAHSQLLPESKRQPSAADDAMDRLDKPFRVLNDHLGRQLYLMGERFTIADLNVASVIGWVTAAGADINNYPNLAAWMTRCSNRPAARKCMGLPPEI